MAEWIARLRAVASELLETCAIIAALDLLVEEDRLALAFRSVCGLTITLTILRALLSLFK